MGDARLVQIERIIDPSKIVVEMVSIRAVYVLGMAAELPVNEGISAHALLVATSVTVMVRASWLVYVWE